MPELGKCGDSLARPFETSAVGKGAPMKTPAPLAASKLLDPTHEDHQLIFSLLDDCVWANWNGTMTAVRLGNVDLVVATMREFLEQCDLAVRLENAAQAER